MKIKSLQISNILSFKYVENISSATEIKFDDGLNILIGENGSGKSTALEVLNFIFRKIIFKQFNVNSELYYRESSLNANDKKQILTSENTKSYASFRLEPNWNSENQAQKIKIQIELDEIDFKNIQNLKSNRDKISSLQSLTNHQSNLAQEPQYQTNYTIEIDLKKSDKNFSVSVQPKSDDGYLYLENYHYYKELIHFYNLRNSTNQIVPLYESFILIGSYRNYSTFNSKISIGGNNTAANQIYQIKKNEYSRSLNASETAEPSIFNLVRLRVAEKHFDLIDTNLNKNECDEEANKLPFIVAVNQKLKLVNLECKIRLTNKASWEYDFDFFDIKRQKRLENINSLSAGQKAIVHLVFEAYGRADLKGGLAIIDEPEIHLHYQFQHEYLRIIEEINKEQKCQYILVTHSESLINSTTIHKVKRFALDQNNNTVIKNPDLSTDRKLLIKILDNARASYAFFAKKVVLVEGETDRFFFKALIQEKYPEANQEIAILDITGKPNYSLWKDFFEDFGLSVHFIGDLDAAFGFLYSNETPYKLNSPEIIAGFKEKHTTLNADIEAQYSKGIYILKDGDLELYLGIHNKGISETIKFCEEKLKDFLNDDNNERSKEIRNIFEKIIK